MACIFITHPEVVVDPGVPVADWSLSEVGKDRATRLPGQLRDAPRAVVCSAERKAIETATILAAALDLQMTVDPGLGEMDRTATGHLPPAMGADPLTPRCAVLTAGYLQRSATVVRAQRLILRAAPAARAAQKD